MSKQKKIAEQNAACIAQESKARATFASADYRAACKAGGYNVVALLLNSESSQKIVGRRVNVREFKTEADARLFAKAGNDDVIEIASV